MVDGKMSRRDVSSCRERERGIVVIVGGRDMTGKGEFVVRDGACVVYK